MRIISTKLAEYMAGNGEDNKRQFEKLLNWCSKFEGLEIQARNYRECLSMVNIRCTCGKPYSEMAVRFMELVKKWQNGDYVGLRCGCKKMAEIHAYVPDLEI